MFYSMFTRYRVVCSQNPEKPEKVYIDICRDGFCSHDLMFQLQKKKYCDDKLERIFNDSRGIMLKEGRDGSVALLYTYHRDIMARKAQNEMRARIDPLIIQVFRRMKEEGHCVTFSMPMNAYSQERGEILKRDGNVQCLQDEIALAEILRKERLEKLKKVRHDFYAKQKYAAAPHLRLMLAQAERSGD
ncbi:MAG: hypothetical protein NC218_05290 [Acetobacter sp.]|nr:hypothetical protein [Acetobacter sp.]